MTRTAPLHTFSAPRLSHPISANTLCRIRTVCGTGLVPTADGQRISFESRRMNCSTAYSNWEVGYGSDQGDRERARAV
jgi:hypothetical protein